jgi:hypothetical protein
MRPCRLSAKRVFPRLLLREQRSPSWRATMDRRRRTRNCRAGRRALGAEASRRVANVLGARSAPRGGEGLLAKHEQRLTPSETHRATTHWNVRVRNLQTTDLSQTHRRKHPPLIGTFGELQLQASSARWIGTLVLWPATLTLSGHISVNCKLRHERQARRYGIRALQLLAWRLWLAACGFACAAISHCRRLPDGPGRRRWCSGAPRHVRVARQPPRVRQRLCAVGPRAVGHRRRALEQTRRAYAPTP